MSSICIAYGSSFFWAHACGDKNKITHLCRTEAALPTSDQTENTAQKNEQDVCCCYTATDKIVVVVFVVLVVVYPCCYDCCYYCFCRYRCRCHYCDCSRFSNHDSISKPSMHIHGDQREGRKKAITPPLVTSWPGEKALSMMGRPRAMASPMMIEPALVTMQSIAPIQSCMFGT